MRINFSNLGFQFRELASDLFKILGGNALGFAERLMAANALEAALGFGRSDTLELPVEAEGTRRNHCFGILEDRGDYRVALFGFRMTRGFQDPVRHNEFIGDRRKMRRGGNSQNARH